MHDGARRWVDHMHAGVAGLSVSSAHVSPLPRRSLRSMRQTACAVPAAATATLLAVASPVAAAAPPAPAAAPTVPRSRSTVLLHTRRRAGRPADCRQHLRSPSQTGVRLPCRRWVHDITLPP
eukprot:COSAG01_NODE_28444_length_660_cov_54.443850_1_plen_121_part_01